MKNSKLLLFIIITCVINSIHSQDTIFKQSTVNKIMKLSEYKRKSKVSNIKKASDKLLIKGKDTFVAVQIIKGSHNKLPKGVSVPYEYKDSTFLEIYSDIVFYKHHKYKPKAKPTMKYWKGDIKLFFSKSIDKKIKKELLSFSKKLSEGIDSLRIRQVNRLEQSNYVIYAINSKKSYKYDERIDEKNSVGYYINWNDRQNLYKCSLQLNPQVMKDLDSLIINTKIKFFTSLGYFTHTDLLDCKNILSNCYNGNAKKPSSLDLELLKYHYSYGICKGTDLKTFENQHKKAKETMKQPHSRMSFYHTE